jgi:transaldolase
MAPPNLLTALRGCSELVPETAELEVVRRFRPRHVNLSAARITAAAQQPEHARIVDDAVAWAQKDLGKGKNRKAVAMRAVERLAVEFTQEMLGLCEGRVSIEVDGRLAFKKKQLVDKARSLVGQLEELGIAKDRVLAKIPATWEGIEAAAELQQKHGIGCHLTLVFGMHQLAAAADAGVLVVTPAAGRITDFHKKDSSGDYRADDDPAIALVAAMDEYVRRHAYPATVMAGMFRGLDQAVALAGCPMLTLPPAILEELEQREGVVEPRLGKEGAAERAADKIAVDAARFIQMHKQDACASSKLHAGVQNLSWAMVSQEKQLGDWILARQDEAAKSSTIALFQTWDYDGDGYIDREEWSGTEEVFNALDRDKNGRISLEEMAIGLGAPYKRDD